MTDKIGLALSAIAVATGILTYLQGRKTRRQASEAETLPPR